jgi:hypothetical protein
VAHFDFDFKRRRKCFKKLWAQISFSKHFLSPPPPPIARFLIIYSFRNGVLEIGLRRPFFYKCKASGQLLSLSFSSFPSCPVFSLLEHTR